MEGERRILNSRSQFRFHVGRREQLKIDTGDKEPIIMESIQSPIQEILLIPVPEERLI